VAITVSLGPLSTIAIPGLPTLELGWVGWPLTVLWIVGMTNAFNFMDGSDGMAALGAVVAGVAMAALGWQLKVHLPLLLAVFAAAAAGGFLVFNWNPARVFMGDVGSAFLGTYLAAVPLSFPEPQRSLAFIPMVLALWPYVFDPFVSVLRRVYHKKNPFEPHREFLFHRLIRSGIAHGPAALLYALLAAVGGLVGILMATDLLPAAVRACGPLVVIALAGGLAWAIERRCVRVGLPSAAGK
jgi:UDP-N-acetylmuramyl pentapeptide phosphotransferase/UDP-N-acetylglucosamine-1-phosphate transferase